MANVTLVFRGTERSKTEKTELELFHSIENEIAIYIIDQSQYSIKICLDRDTAIRLHKELKKQISYFREEESNG